MRTLPSSPIGLCLAGIAVAVSCVSGAAGEEITLKHLATGAMPKMGGYMPQRLKLSADKPDEVKKLPAGVTAPLFGLLKLGPKETPTTIALLVDEPAGQQARLFVDANGNGDLTDDPPATWNKRAYKAKDGADLNQYSGDATVKVAYGGTTEALHVPMYRFDPRDAGRDTLKDTLLYYSDYGKEGTVSLGGKEYQALLTDKMATGDFRSTGATLFIDANGDGKFDGRYEAFTAGKPFNIGGTTYEIAGVEASGSKLRIEKSTQTVAEQKAPAAILPGKAVTAFKATTTDGKAVDFPADYKGKLVLLDFWATWCGPCVAELPHLTAAYEKFHPQGMEILGISLDQPDAGKKLADFVKQKNMTWAQVHDGTKGKTEVAELYSIRAIPTAYLVDGDTGQIVATGSSLRGSQLEKTIADALAKKKK